MAARRQSAKAKAAKAAALVQLNDAATKGDLERVKAALMAGADVGAQEMVGGVWVMGYPTRLGGSVISLHNLSFMGSEDDDVVCCA